jgi:capsular exopolysaccharide synthesis family protein
LELREYWFIVRKWWWLLLACTLLGAGTAFVVSKSIDPTYEASTLLMIGGSIDVVNPTTGELLTSEKLAQTYAELLQTRPVVQTTMISLGLAEEPEITVSLVRNTQLLRLTVADTVPERAAATADELARQLIQQSPSAPERDEQQYREFVDEQLGQLQADISSLSQTILDRRDTLSSEELARLQQTLEDRRSNYSALLAYTRSSSTNFIRVIETAEIPEDPSSPKVLQNTLLAAIVGLMLAAGVAFLIEYLDDSVKSLADIETVLGLPSLGAVFDVQRKDGVEPATIARTHPDAGETEAYRILDLNLRYSLPADSPDRVFMITSVGPSEGKSTTASNLAAVMAGAGQRVILVDADLRRPTQHRFHDLFNEKGLSSLLVGEETDVEAVLRTTELPSLRLLTAGPIPPNAAVLLASERMKSLLKELAEISDTVIVDSPPLFAAADASVLAGFVSGSILVVEAGRTKAVACTQAAEDLQRLGSRFLGVVLNRHDAPRGSYYGGYYGYGYYGGYKYGTGKAPASRWDSVRGWLTRRLPGRRSHKSSAHRPTQA